MTDEFITAERTFSLLNGKAFYDGPLYRSGIISVFGLPVAAVSLGIARTAIDTLIELAGGKLPTLSRTMLRDRGTVQAQVAQAEALLRSARAFVFETVASVWDAAERGDKLSEEQEALVRLSITYAAECSADAVKIAYTLGGATSVYTSSKLERCFRDAHVVTQHIAVSPVWYERTGQHFLGMGLPLIT
jgi:alkylation response protein AidB-like acyl-CoA dehydrogenase